MVAKTNGKSDTEKAIGDLVGDAKVFGYEAVYAIPMAEGVYKKGAQVFVRTTTDKLQRVTLGDVIDRTERYGMDIVFAAATDKETLFDPKKAN